MFREYLGPSSGSRLRLKCDGTRAKTKFRLSVKQTSPFKSAGASVQSTTGSRGVRISGSNAGYIMFRGNVKGAGYTLHSPFSPSLPLPCVTVCHHISTGLYNRMNTTDTYYSFSITVYFPGWTTDSLLKTICRVETESGGTRRRTGGEVKGKEANGVGSQQSSA